MVVFYTDTDLSGAGEFAEATVSLATEFDLPACTFNRMRAPFPAVAGATVLPRLYNAAGGVVFTATGFDTTVVDAWNWATPVSPIPLAAGLYRPTEVVTRYKAIGGFFSGGSITRGGMTAIRGKFDSGDVAPTQNSTATYFVDMEIVIGGVTVQTGMFMEFF